MPRYFPQDALLVPRGKRPGYRYFLIGPARSCVELAPAPPPRTHACTHASNGPPSPFDRTSTSSGNGC